MTNATPFPKYDIVLSYDAPSDEGAIIISSQTIGIVLTNPHYCDSVAVQTIAIVWKEVVHHMKLFDSELKVMKVLWERGDVTAKEISNILAEAVGWNMNTTYTVIKKCVAKGAIQRREPGFVCHALISREEVRAAEAGELVDKLFDGEPELLFASLLGGGRPLTKEQLARLRDWIDQQE